MRLVEISESDSAARNGGESSRSDLAHPAAIFQEQRFSFGGKRFQRRRMHAVIHLFTRGSKDETTQAEGKRSVGTNPGDDLLAQVAALAVAHRVLLEAGLGQNPLAAARIGFHPQMPSLDAQQLEHRGERRLFQMMETRRLREPRDPFLQRRGKRVIRRQTNQKAAVPGQRSVDQPGSPRRTLGLGRTEIKGGTARPGTLGLRPDLIEEIGSAWAL